VAASSWQHRIQCQFLDRLSPETRSHEAGRLLLFMGIPIYIFVPIPAKLLPNDAATLSEELVIDLIQCRMWWSSAKRTTHCLTNPIQRVVHVVGEEVRATSVDAMEHSKSVNRRRVCEKELAREQHALACCHLVFAL